MDKKLLEGLGALEQRNLTFKWSNAYERNVRRIAAKYNITTQCLEAVIGEYEDFVKEFNEKHA